MSSLTDRLFVVFQRLLPAGLIGRCVYRLARIETRWFKDAVIRGMVAIFDIDTAEAAAPVPAGYATANEFFTRQLKDGARPVDAAAGAVCSPADGTVVACGTIEGNSLLQAKGLYYGLDALLGGEPSLCGTYRNGAFMTVYLAPHNYHRVHAPLPGRLRRMDYLPGGRLAVNAATARTVPGLFAGNERLACHFDGPHGPWCIVLVGAMNVSCITTAWSGQVLPDARHAPRRWDFDAGSTAPRLDRGDWLGQFELGSTVILLMPPSSVHWDAAATDGHAVRMGRRIGVLL